MPALMPGRTLSVLASGGVCRVESLVDEGGQGEVYFVEFNGRRFALKWYHSQILRVDTRLRSRLQVAIDRGAPSARFLWPFSLVTMHDGSGLGYLMPVRRASYGKMWELFNDKGTIKPSFRALATTGCLLANELFALHAKGLVYQDLNPGNVFLEPHSGNIEICDNDNVDIDGAPSVMGGVWEYQAPEVILRQSGPRRSTDLHSLAVMLFRILHIGHPLIGLRSRHYPDLTDPAAIRSLYATDARFVFDPKDDSNRPIPHEQSLVSAYWAIYPAFLRDLFTRAFTEGLRDPLHGRVQETEWRQALGRLRDAVMTCQACKARNFFDRTRISAQTQSFPCWSCSTALSANPPRIGIHSSDADPRQPPAHVIVLDEGARVFAHQIAGVPYNFEAVCAEVLDQPSRLRNSSRQMWGVERRGGRETVAPGATLALETGIRINFGSAIGEVRMPN
jgi:DNA-binding helix-hairpin-helix protein with protein kinase domain